MDHHGICRMLNYSNNTCKTELQRCASHFTIILGLGETDISVSANSECVSNRKHCSYYTFARIKFINHQASACD